MVEGAPLLREYGVYSSIEGSTPLSPPETNRRPRTAGPRCLVAQRSEVPLPGLRGGDSKGLPMRDSAGKQRPAARGRIPSLSARKQKTRPRTRASGSCGAEEGAKCLRTSRGDSKGLPMRDSAGKQRPAARGRIPLSPPETKDARERGRCCLWRREAKSLRTSRGGFEGFAHARQRRQTAAAARGRIPLSPPETKDARERGRRCFVAQRSEVPADFAGGFRRVCRSATAPANSGPRHVGESLSLRSSRSICRWRAWAGTSASSPRWRMRGSAPSRATTARSSSSDNPSRRARLRARSGHS